MHPTFTSLGSEHPRPSSAGKQLTESTRPLPTQQEFSASVLKPGSSALAQVIKATPATDAQRQRLINLYTGMANNPSDEQHIKQKKFIELPARLQGLLQSPSLALVELKFQGQLQLALSTTPLRSGQAVEVRQSTNGALQIISDTASGATNTLTTQSRLTQALKTNLPQHAHSESLSGQLGKLQALQQLLQAQPSSMRTVLTQQLLQSIKQLLQQPASAQQLSQPEQLKQQLKKAGPAMESQLKGLSSDPTKPLNTPLDNKQRSRGDKTPAPVTPHASLKPNLLGNHKSPETNNTTSRPAAQMQPAAIQQSIEPLNNDFKALLLASLQLSQIPSGAALSHLKASELDQALAKLLTPLLQQHAPSAASQDTAQLSSDKLLLLLQHQLQKILGRVQLQQLQALNKKLQSSEGGTVLQHLQLELPIRHGQELYSLTIQIDEKIHHQEKEKEGERQASEREQVRQWQVKLAFDLPEGGRLHAHLSIIDDSVNASLWAEDPQLLNKAREQLANLRERMLKDGLDVKTLDCFAGSPPETAIELRYNLVDIKT